MIKSNVLLTVLVLAIAGCTDNTTQAEKPTQTQTTVSQKNYRDISVTDAANMIASTKDLVVLDIRSPEEFAEGHIEGAVNVDFRQANFAAELANLDKDQTYLLHCHSGGRSSKSIKILEELGFTDIAHMKQGIQGWRAAGQPQVTQ